MTCAFHRDHRRNMRDPVYLIHYLWARLILSVGEWRRR
jgi:hypothetical protein